MASEKNKGGAATASPSEAPGAETVQKEADPKPKRVRKSFYEDGKDFVLLSIERDNEGNPVPNGGLRAVPPVKVGTDDDGNDILEEPRFESAQEAARWITAKGAALAGFHILIIKMCEKVTVAVQNKPTVTISREKRFVPPAS